MSLPPPPSWIAPYPELIPVHQAAVASDLAAVLSAYQNLPTVALRTAAVGIVGDVDGAREMLIPVADSPGFEPEQLLVRTMLAHAMVTIGWGIRTGHRAENVSQEQFRAFHDHLRIAERLLLDVIARQPDNVAAWRTRLTSARGLQLGQSEVRRRYDQSARFEPHLLAPQLQVMQQLCPKWGGTFEQLHAFARECAFAAPPGSVNGLLVAQGHLEHWVELPEGEDKAYLTSSAVQQEVAAAANHSVLNQAFDRDFGWVLAHATFACFYSASDNPAAAAAHFRAIESFDSSWAWRSYFGPAAYDQHRTAALAKG